MSNLGCDRAVHAFFFYSCGTAAGLWESGRDGAHRCDPIVGSGLGRRVPRGKVLVLVRRSVISTREYEAMTGERGLALSTSDLLTYWQSS